MQKEDEKRSFLKRYWWVFIGAVGAVGLATALNFTSVDGWIEIIDYGNDTYDLGWNTTRPTVCSAGNYSYWTGTNFLCSPDTGGSNSSDGNNYTTSQAFEYSGNNVILQTARNGANNVSAFFTFQSSTGILLNNGVFYANATNCTTGQYSRYENNGWNCYNDASGGSGTVTSVALNSTTPSISITGSPITTNGIIVVDIANATVFTDGLMTSTQVTSLNSKALAGNCVGYNTTHVNVTMNATTAGLECVAVALNPGGSSFDPSGLYINVTDLQNSNASTNTRINTINTTVQNLLSSNTSIYTRIDTVNLTTQNLLTSNTTLFGLILQLGQNDTNLNASINAVNTRVTTTNNTLQIALINITDLQNSNASVNVRINTLNTTIQNLLSSNGSVYTRIDTLNTTIQNLLTSNTTIFGLILELGQNDTNLNASINAVNTRATTINATTVSLSTNLTTLSNTAITTFGIRVSGTNSTISNSSTFNIYCGVGVTCNTTTTSPLPGVTIVGGTGDAAGTYQNISDLQIRAPNTTSYLTGRSMPYLEQEFMNAGGVQAYSWLAGAAVGTTGGTATLVSGTLLTSDHPGVLSLRDSVTTDGGYSVKTANTAFLLRGDEFFRINLKAPGGKPQTTIVLAGFLDTDRNITGISDGCWYTINLTQTNSRTLRASCRNASTETNSLTNYTYTNDTYVTLNFYYKTQVANFTVTNGSGVILWSENVSYNTPTGNAFRDTGFGVIAYQNSTDAGTSIAEIDYMGVGINRTLPRY